MPIGLLKITQIPKGVSVAKPKLASEVSAPCCFPVHAARWMEHDGLSLSASAHLKQAGLLMHGVNEPLGHLAAGRGNEAGKTDLVSHPQCCSCFCVISWSTRNNLTE